MMQLPQLPAIDQDAAKSDKTVTDPLYLRLQPEMPWLSKFKRREEPSVFPRSTEQAILSIAGLHLPNVMLSSAGAAFRQTAIQADARTFIRLPKGQMDAYNVM
eukprot:jgi/Ulvmu1/319/UM001_0323.1